MEPVAFETAVDECHGVLSKIPTFQNLVEAVTSLWSARKCGQGNWRTLQLPWIYRVSLSTVYRLCLRFHPCIMAFSLLVATMGKL